MNILRRYTTPPPTTPSPQATLLQPRHVSPTFSEVSTQSWDSQNGPRPENDDSYPVPVPQESQESQ